MNALPPILLIAAGSSEREGLKEMLERRGHAVTDVEEAGEARTYLDDACRNRGWSIVLDLAGSEALKFLRTVTVQRAGIPVICVTDRRKPDAVSDALRLGIADLVARPVREDELGTAIANANEFAATARAPKPEPPPAADVSTGGLFGASPAIRENVDAGETHRAEPLQRAGPRRAGHRPGVGGARDSCPESASRPAVREDRMGDHGAGMRASRRALSRARGRTIYLEDIGRAVEPTPSGSS